MTYINTDESEKTNIATYITSKYQLKVVHFQQLLSKVTLYYFYIMPKNLVLCQF